MIRGATRNTEFEPDPLTGDATTHLQEIELLWKLSPVSVAVHIRLLLFLRRRAIQIAIHLHLARRRQHFYVRGLRRMDDGWLGFVPCGLNRRWFRPRYRRLRRWLSRGKRIVHRGGIRWPRRFPLLLWDDVMRMRTVMWQVCRLGKLVSKKEGLRVERARNLVFTWCGCLWGAPG